MKYFVALTLVAFSVLSHAKTLQVGKNFPYKTIKEALAASENSDTLIIIQVCTEKVTSLLKKPSA